MRILVHPAAAAQMENLVQRPGGTVLLHGPAQVGKFTVAREVARRLNCEGCEDGSCRSCRMAVAGNHPDIVVVAPDDKHKIGIEVVHELQHMIQYQQYEAGSQRVVIIRGADTLTLPAQNALLKTLEEPPAGTTVILTAVSPTALLPTVVSRCRLVYLPPVSGDQLRLWLQEQYPDVQAELVAALSHGAPGRAVDYASDTSTMAADRAIAQEIESLLATQSLFERLVMTGRMAAASEQRARYLQELTVQARATARTEGASTALEAVERLRERLRANVTPKTAFEALAVELA